MAGEIRIRAARPDDSEWIMALVPRLHEFGPPPWHEVATMNSTVRASLASELASPSDGSAILVAEDAAGGPLGFVSLMTDRDYFTGLAVGHISDLVVTRAAEGGGVGRALLIASEDWAAKAGYPWITLHVFRGNDRARRIYEKNGYDLEWIRMLKPLRRGSS
jgi:GNAT superfamily N-acetyltransferase